MLVYGLVTGWTVSGPSSGGARFSAQVRAVSRAHSASFTVGTGSFRYEGGQGVALIFFASYVDVQERTQLYRYPVLLF